MTAALIVAVIALAVIAYQRARLSRQHLTSSPYSVRDIERAVTCVEQARDGNPNVSTWAVFSHLEGRCGCNRNRCPECGERERRGVIHHLASCPKLRSTQP